MRFSFNNWKIYSGTGGSNPSLSVSPTVGYSKGWKEQGGYLVKVFEFDSFIEAVDFVNKIITNNKQEHRISKEDRQDRIDFFNCLG